MTTFGNTYVEKLTAALQREVREMVAYKVVALPGADHAVAVPDDADANDFVMTIEPLQQERLPDALLPIVTVTVLSGVVRVEARGRVLEQGLNDVCYHYEPDGLAPEEHAGWIAELRMEDGA